MAVEKKRFVNRRDTSANWSTVNPTLEAGEIGYDTDKKKFKMGDGTSDWDTLDFYEAGGNTYTPGTGVKIENNQISLKTRSSQFAYNGNGEMYLITTGDGGFVTNRVMEKSIKKYLGEVEEILITI